jgi:hypothetical protein
MGQIWCPLKLSGHHGLRRLRQEDLLAGRIRNLGDVLLGLDLLGAAMFIAHLLRILPKESFAISTDSFDML